MLDEISFGSRGLTLKLSRDAAKAGAPEAARTLEQSGLADFATAYAFVHEELTDDRFHGARVHLQDVLVDKARALATRQKLQPDEVRRLFRNGSPILRVLSLGLMKGDPSLADASLISAAIVEPRSRNEQYHGLDLARLMWPLLSTSERAFIKTHIEGARVPPDSDRHRLAQDILLRQTE